MSLRYSGWRRPACLVIVHIGHNDHRGHEYHTITCVIATWCHAASVALPSRQADANPRDSARQDLLVMLAIRGRRTRRHS